MGEAHSGSAAAIRRTRDAVLAAVRDPAGGATAVARVCQACVELVPVDGASISAIGGGQHRETLYASDEVIGMVESIQFTLGEGPCYQAFSTGRPVLVPDLARSAATAAWPVFAAQTADLPIGAIFAFPVQHGAISIGAMEFYRRRPGWLSELEVAVALQVLDLAVMALLGANTDPADDQPIEAWLAPFPRSREEVHQATGMIIAALGVPAEQALARLRGYAFAAGRLIEDVAHDITTGRLKPTEIDT
jgi:GAF domain-containing protein